jgi:RNA polymerase sigma-70 factor (ECF subfamily)
LFNAHDWDGVRALLADDVKLDLVSRRKLAGREVGSYLTNYEGARDWHLTPAWLDGREVLGVHRDPSAARPGSVIALTWHEGRVQTIRDYRYVPYIAQEGEFQFAG